MTRILSVLNFFIVFAFLPVSGLAQLGGFEKPVQWEVSVDQLNKDSLSVEITAAIEDDWYMYLSKSGDGGPILLSYNFDDSQDYELIGSPQTSSAVEKAVYEEAFKMDVVKVFQNYSILQNITTLNTDGEITGSLTYQTCKEVCLPPQTLPFVIRLNDLQTAIGESNVAAISANKQTNVIKGEAINWPDYGEPINDCKNDATAGSSDDTTSNWSVFLLGVLGGLVAILTPCVFPMIPLTVTFFTKRNEERSKGVFEAILYGFSIFLIYFLLALPFLVFQLPKDTLYRIATSPFLNVLFFVIFILFALSLFGYFELTLPSKWANKTDKVSNNKGGIVGIFFMAITLAIVSFSCTGPILGSLMAGTIATEGGQLKLVYGMSGFGVALGLPFALFALFPGVLKKLPKSGSWMNTVKVVLAFVEVALALKFLSNADLVQQWGVIKYEVFLAVWLAITIGLALYLFGFIRFPHDLKNQKIGWGRKLIGVASLIFAGYITTGFMGNHLNILSGFPPPKHYSIFDTGVEEAITDLDRGFEIAKSENKPVLIDFTGWTCVNCRKVEENIWTNEEVESILKNDVVLVSLYADESRKLPEEEVYYSSNLDKTIDTEGEKWTDFEASTFGKISQPLYALVTPEGQLLNAPIAFTNSVQDYKDFLECGIFTYRDGL